jgi:hypothetical protein
LVYRYDPFRRYSTAAREMRPTMASNPGDWAFVGTAAGGAAAAVVAGAAVVPRTSGVKPVENWFMVPAVIETGAERSWYPSSFRRSVWLPGERPEKTSGERPRKSPSIYTAAPAGVVVTVRDPVPAGAAAVPATDAVVVAPAAVVVVPEAAVVAVTAAVVPVVVAVVVAAVVVVVTVVVGVVGEVVATAVRVFFTRESFCEQILTVPE